MSRDMVFKYLREALNTDENFQFVSRDVNLIDHRKHDQAIIDQNIGDQCSKRSKDIIEFLEDHLVRLIPCELTVSFVETFRKSGMITSATAEKIKRKAKMSAPKLPVGTITTTTAEQIKGKVKTRVPKLPT